MNNRFIKNDENSVVLNVPAGKRYITSPTPANQERQKGSTCWYYAFNILRMDTRIGKLDALYSPIESKTEQAPHPSIASLIKQREYEKIISSHRKAITAIDTENIETVVMKKLLETLGSIGSSPNATYNIDPEYTENDMLKMIKLCKSTLKKLGYKNPETELIKWGQEMNKVTRHDFNREIYDALSTEKKFSLWWELMSAKVREKYQIRDSKWHPRDGFDGLMHSLKTEGLLNVGGVVGTFYYKESPKKGNILGPYQVYYWPPLSEKKCGEGDIGHKVTICGAERVRTANKTQETILFIDPSDVSSPDEPRRVYRISFKNLLSTLSNIHGVITSIPFTYFNTPYALCEPSQEFRDDLEQSYRNLLALYINCIQDSIKEYKKGNWFLSFDGRKRVKQVESLLQEQKADQIESLPALTKKINAVTSKRDYQPAHKSRENGLDTILLKNLKMNHLFFELPPVACAAVANDVVRDLCRIS